MPVNFDGHLGVEEGTFVDRKILSPFDKQECVILKGASGIAGKCSWTEMRGLTGLSCRRPDERTGRTVSRASRVLRFSLHC
jgi:hypothetical protein